MTPDFELRQARAEAYLRKHHQARLAEAVRSSGAPASRGWFVLLAVLVGVALLVGLTADPADASPAQPRFTLGEVKHAARAFNFELAVQDGPANGTRWFPRRETCRRTSKQPLRYRCSIWGLSQYALDGGDDTTDLIEYRATRCTGSRTARSYWWYNGRLVMPVNRRGGLRCALAVYVWRQDGEPTGFPGTTGGAS